MEPTKALAPTNSAGPLATQTRDEMDAFGQATQEDLVIPVRKLVQAVSRTADSRHAGEFFDPLTESYDPELLVALLAMSRSRSLFEEGDFEAPPICVSDDGVKPRQQVEYEDGLTGPTCAECAFSQWGTARGGKGKGQSCRFTYNLLCFDLNEQQPFILRVSGTSIAPWRRYLTAGRFGKAPAYALELRIGAEAKTFDSGRAWVLNFKNGGPLPADVAEAMRGIAASYRGVSLGVEEAVEEIPFE